MASKEKRTIRERFACWRGKHPALERTAGPFGWPDAYTCVACGRLDHLIEASTGLRYSCLEQFVGERGDY